MLAAGLSGASTSKGEPLIYLLVVAPWSRPVQLALAGLVTALVTSFTSMFGLVG